MTFYRIGGEDPQVVHEIPNVIGRFYLAVARHARESDAVVDDPKQLLVGVTLHSLAGEICSTRVHPASQWSLSPAVDTVACGALQAVMSTAAFNTAFCVCWRRRTSEPASWANHYAFDQIRHICFKRARLSLCGQTEM